MKQKLTAVLLIAIITLTACRAVAAAAPTKSADNTYALRVGHDRVPYRYSKAQVRAVNCKEG